MLKLSKVGRYSHNEQGKAVRVADVYFAQDHQIDNKKIDDRVFQIASQLKLHGYDSYLVGGAIRDLLLGQQPKDFDIVTNAAPSEIRKIIRNSRIIGKRFRLVHVFYKGGDIIEVITFRSLDSSDHNHLYGTIEEDVQRRDFTANALYYDLNKEQILDFIGAMADFRKRQIRNIIALPKIFKEDPVRIIRCIKYAAKAGFKIPKKIILQLRRDANLLYSCSKSRLSEELNKILYSEQCHQIMKDLQQFGILEIMLPCLALKKLPNSYKASFTKNMLVWQKCLQQHNQVQSLQAELKLKKLAYRQHGGYKEPSKMEEPLLVEGHLGKHLLGIGLSYLLAAYFQHSFQWQRLQAMGDEERTLAAYLQIKECLNDLNTPNVEVWTACKHLFMGQGLPFEPRLIVKKYGQMIDRQRPKFSPKKPCKKSTNKAKNTGIS